VGDIRGQVVHPLLAAVDREHLVPEPLELARHGAAEPPETDDHHLLRRHALLLDPRESRA
jgi:hypothetical protein